jgi:hypothetical protein
VGATFVAVGSDLGVFRSATQKWLDALKITIIEETDYDAESGFYWPGIMGKPMSKNLIKAGYSLVVPIVIRKPWQR